MDSSLSFCHLDKNAAGETVDVINLKADEKKTVFLHKIRGIYPAYHMNHKKWISVTLDDTLDDRDVMDLVDESFRLTNDTARVLNESLIREALEIADSIPPGTSGPPETLSSSVSNFVLFGCR